MSYTTPTALTETSLTVGHFSFSWTASNNDAPNLSLLLHMDGTNGSTTFVDSSINNFTITVSGSAAIETVHTKFGTGAMNQPSTTTAALSYIYTSITQNGPLDILEGTTDFTVDGWFYVPSTSGTNAVLLLDYGSPPAGSLHANIGGFQIIVNATPIVSLRLTCNTNSWTGADYNPTIAPDTWHHFALVRISGNPVLFFDGVKMNSVTIAPWTGYTYPTTQPSVIQLGSNFGLSSSSIAPFYIDEFRVSKGVALWTASFTPPTSPTANPGPPPGYTVFRNGVEIGQVLTPGVVSYTDNTIQLGVTYSYTVAAQDGTDVLVSAISDPITITVSPPPQAAFVPSGVFKAVQVGRVSGIIPRIWPSKNNNTVYG